MTKLTHYRLSELYNISSGISSKPSQAGHGYPFCSFSTVFNNMYLPETLPDLMDTSIQERITYSIMEGDVFLTRTSETVEELGMSAVAVKDYPNATYSGFVKRLRPISDRTYSKFMALVFRSRNFRKAVTNKAVMTLRASFNEETFNDICVDLPPMEFQKQIGDLFYDIECKKRINDAICSDLEAMAKLLYNYWFVQFDFPDENGKPYKSCGGKMVWNEQLKREIPEGWAKKEVSAIANIVANSVTPRPDIEYRHYSIPAFDEKGMPVEESGASINSNKYLVPENAILVSKLNPQFKRIWVISDSDDRSICSTEFIPFVSIEGHREYLYSLLNSDAFHTYMVQCSSSSTGSRTRIDPELCLRFSFASPKDNALIERYCKTVAPMLSQIEELKDENQQLTSLRDFLLPMLMNGQVKVSTERRNG